MADDNKLERLEGTTIKRLGRIEYRMTKKDRDDYNIIQKLMEQENLTGKHKYKIVGDLRILTEEEAADVKMSERYQKLSGASYKTFNKQREIRSADIEYADIEKWRAARKEWFFRLSSDENIWDSYSNVKIFIYINEIKNTAVATVEQIYQKGNKNCLLSPIYKWIKEKLISISKDTKMSDKTKANYQSIMNKTKKLLIQYKDGVDTVNIQKIVDILKFRINIHDVLGRPIIEAKPAKGRERRAFNYINNIFNHVESFNIDNVINKTGEELFNISKQLDETNIPYYYTKSDDEYRFIVCNDAKYMNVLPHSSKYRELNRILGIEGFLTNIDTELGKFIDNGVRVACSYELKDPFILPDDELELLFHVPISHFDEIDEKTHYLQFNGNEYYEGFPTLFNEYRRIDKYDLNTLKTGYYYINNLDLTDAPPVIQKIGVFHDTRVYPLPVLKFMSKIGIKFNITAGAWSYRSINIDSNVILEYCEKNDISYAKYCGWLGRKRFTNTISARCSPELVSAVNIDNYDNYYYNSELGELTLYINNPKRINNCSIFGFITGYALINVLKQAIAIDINDIYKIVMDGIYVSKIDNINILPTFRIKQKDGYRSVTADSFITEIPYELNIKLPLYDENCVQYVSYTGEGGSGKSHVAIHENKYIHKKYVSPGYKLAKQKYNEYIKHGLNTVVYSKLLSEKYLEKHVKPALLICDEITTLGSSVINKLIMTFKYTKIIFIGDFDIIEKDGEKEVLCYQTKPIDGSLLTPLTLIKQRLFTVNRRFLDDKLKNISKFLRQCIRDDEHIQFVRNHLLDLLKDSIVSRDTLEKIYKKEELILVSTHKIREGYDAMFKHIPKYYIEKSKGDFSRGDIVYEPSKKKNHKLRHGYTIHSCQGETIPTIYIDLRDIFQIQQIYVAVSRVRNIGDIKLIM
jgi:hypothetical protein